MHSVLLHRMDQLQKSADEILIRDGKEVEKAMTKDEEREMLEKIRREVEILQDGFPEADIFVNVFYPIPGEPGNEWMQTIHVNKKGRTKMYSHKREIPPEGLTEPAGR